MSFSIFLGILTIFFCTLTLKRRFLSPLSRYPGPFLASVTRLWYTFISWQGSQHEIFPRLHEQYGGIVRVAPNEVHICTKEALRALYGTGSYCEKSDWFKVFQGNRKFDLVSERDRHTHAAQRRLVAQTYSATTLRIQENYIDVTLKQLLSCLDSKINQPFDISPWIQYWSFDTIGMMTFSKAFGFLKAGEDWNNALYQIRAAGDSAAWIGQNPWLYKFCQRTIFPIFGNPFALANRNGAVRNFAVTQCHIRQNEGASAQPDIMQKLLQTHDRNPVDFDDDAVQSMAATNVFGGAETTTSSIRAVIYFLLKNRDVLTKLRNEVDKTCREHSLPTEAPVPLDLADAMPYLQAVIYESMRLFPANGLPLARVAPSEGIEISGYFFPAGTQLTVYSWSLHRDRTIFGEDAHEFRPERWLDAERARELHRYFFSFGSGARSCLGRNLAWMEMLKIVSTLFRLYEVELADAEAEWVIEGGFIKGQRDINVVLKHRSDSCDYIKGHQN